jgi:hypothetical protein
MNRTFFLSTLLAVLWAPLASAQIPQTMSYQGVLTNVDGKPIANGNQVITSSCTIRLKGPQRFGRRRNP